MPEDQKPPMPIAPPKTSWYDRMPALIWAFSATGAVVVSIVVIWGDHNAMERLKLATGYALLIFLFFLSMVILLDIIRNKIDLSQMLGELSGGASMSRFQLLVFTFVIAFSFFVVVVNNNGKFPEVPNSVLTLLGVSASTYAVSKGMQISSGGASKSSEEASEKASDKKPNQPQDT
jgi:hypothetical protein